MRSSFIGSLAIVALALSPHAVQALAIVQQDTTAAPPDTTAQDTTVTDPLPLEPARALRGTFSEGTWISLDVSPDGRTIVFDLLGDLWTLPIDGGAATRLTEGMAYDAQPRFSPDGERVVFVSDRSGAQNVWTMAVDASDTTQVTQGMTDQYFSPEYTPDGDYIVVSKMAGTFGAAKLQLYHVEGGSGAQLIEEPQNLKTMGAAFGDDPRYIWFAERQGDWQYNAILPQYQLAVYDRETGERTTMSSRYGSAFRPALSPDGRWLVYGTRHDEETGLRVRDLDTGEERWLAYPVQRDDQESRATLDVLPGYAFTPDSRAVVVSYGGRIWRVPVSGAAPAGIPFTAEVDVPIGPEVDFDYPIEDTPTFTVRQIRDAVPAPDGSRLAFTALDRLYVMDFPDGTPRRLTDHAIGEFHPTWSPDGRFIAFVTWDDEEGGHLWRIRADGLGAPQRLTQEPAFYDQPAWSPDARRIVARRSASRDVRQAPDQFAFGGRLGAEFVWVPASGGQVTAIAPAGNLGFPHFTRTSDRIYASDGSDGVLVSFRWDGTDRREHVKVTGWTMPGAQQPLTAQVVLMAPEGDQALAKVNEDLYVVTVPLVGGRTPAISVANPESAPFPVTQLTEIGGQFPAWSGDGRSAHWSIGNAHFVYDLDRAEFVADSLEAAAAAGDEAPDTAAVDTTAADTAAIATGADDEPGYEPLEVRIEVQAPRDIPEGALVLRGVRAITMRGDEVIEDADIVVVDNRIEAVGPRGQVPVPEGAEVRELDGATVVPGFVDTHAHMWPLWGVHTSQVWMYHANLAYGVTTTRDPQTSTTDVLTYADRVRAGELIGPRVYSTGPGVLFFQQIESQDHARDILRRYSDYYDTKTFKMYMSGNRQVRQWLVIAARELGLMPTTEGGLDFQLNLTHAMDGYPGLEHSLPVYPIYDDVVRLFAESGIVYTPTLLVSYGGPFGENWYYATEEVHDDPKLRRFTPHSEIDAKSLRRGNNPGPGGWFRREQYVFEDHARFVRDLIEAGGRAGVGSHGQLQGLGYHWELWSLQSGGLDEHDALRAATLFGAEAIGLDEDIGSIEPGKLADLVILDRDPLEDIRNTNTVRHVMKNGRLYDGDTLDELWPRQRAFPLPDYDDEPAPVAGVRR